MKGGGNLGLRSLWNSLGVCFSVPYRYQAWARQTTGHQDIAICRLSRAPLRNIPQFHPELDACAMGISSRVCSFFRQQRFGIRPRWKRDLRPNACLAGLLCCLAAERGLGFGCAFWSKASRFGSFPLFCHLWSQCSSGRIWRCQSRKLLWRWSLSSASSS